MKEIFPSVVALGTFDGVHLGHRQIVAQILEVAEEQDLKPIIVTFFPHPSHVLYPNNPLKLINTIEERVKLLKEYGIESVYVQEFTKEFSEQSADQFVFKILMNELNMRALIVGHDHRFGKNKDGDFEKLNKLGQEYGFSVVKSAPFYKNGYLISSTLIRNLILEGDIINANVFLGYNFCLFGKVVQGNQLGRKIGFNTANIVLDYSNKIIPKLGVYIVKSEIFKKEFWGMMNIGFRPTVDGKTQTIEVHFFNLNEDLYFQKLKIQIYIRIRDEKKFNSIEELKTQLENDKAYALDWIKQIV